jgi:hypothetical protein
MHVSVGKCKVALVGFLWFLKPSMLEPTLCQAANQTKVLKITEMENTVEWGVTQSQTEVAEDGSGLGENCEEGARQHESVLLYRQTIWSIYEMTRSREWVMMDKRSSMVTGSFGMAAPVVDCSIVDEKQGTYVWAEVDELRKVK